ncbi:MAG: GH116 family glycosyl-hydrolase, partial [Planctomycetota bacterium]
MGATSRRDFVKRSASAAAVLSLGSLPVMAGPFPSGSDPHPVPADKKLKPAWIKSLFARGEPQWHQWPESKWVGMPVGGICCGQVYLGGDGRLWLWDIFNRIDNSGSSGPHYAQPMEPTAPFVHGFAIRIERAGAEPQSRILDQSGWERVRFRGEYPIGLVEYRDAASPVEVDLEAFSPFIPLDSTDAALPVTLLHYTVRNTGDTAVTVRLAGWLENAVLRHSGWPGAVTRRNQFQRTQHHAALFCDARCHPSAHEPQPDILFEDFEKETYEGWTVTGTAFGIAPVAETAIPAYQGKIGAHGKRLVNSHATAPGDSVQAKDGGVGRLLSGLFRIERSFIALLIGGGKHAGSTCVNLLVDGQAVATAVGANSNTLRPHRIDARPWKGREARLEIVDSATGGWGNIGVDHIVFTDRADSTVSLPEAPDAGTMALALLCDPKQGVCGCTALPPGELTAEAVFEGISASRNGGAEASERPWEERLTGALERTMELAPGASVGTLCLVSWHFPNLHGLPGGQRKRHYATR